MIHVTFKHIKDKENMLTDCICMILYYQKGKGNRLEMTFLKNYPFLKSFPLRQEQNKTKTHEIQHAQEEIKKLQQADPQYSELTENMKKKTRDTCDFSLYS